MNTPTVQLEYTHAGGNGTVTLTARLGPDVLHTDKVDIVRASSRERFAAAVAERFPGVQRSELDGELLRVAAEVATPAPPPPDAAAPLDVSRIIRPELFHAPEASGLAVPSVFLSGGKPHGRWAQYLRWHADGRRERRELESSIDIPGGGRLWLHPVPAEPEPTTRAGWTQAAREAWLAGAPAPEPVDVLRRLCESFARFLDFPRDAAQGTAATLALWTLLTYCYPAWPAVPYLSIGGPLSSGKSTLFRVLARVVFRPVESSNMTAACLFRTLHERGGTLQLDEAERLRDAAPEAGELRSILLSGYKVGSPALRLEKVGDGFKRTEFDCYGPKAVASIASMPEALASRCIRVAMFRAGVDSPKPRRRLDEEPERWAALRDDLHALALEHGRTWLALARRADVCPASLNGRDFELWQPLLALASWLEERGAGGLLGLVREHAEHVADASRDDAAPESDELLVRLLAEHVQDATTRTLKAGELLKEARVADPVTFARFSPKGVANALGKYGLKTHKGPRSAGRTYARVTVADLRHVVATYGLDVPLPAADVPQGAAAGG